MIIAGEPSGDTLAAELVTELRAGLLASPPPPTADVQPLRTELAPRFFGAGGPRMAAAGVDLAFDLTQHSVIGISDVLKKYSQFRRLFKQLLQMALDRQPDVIIGVDYGGFNLRFGQAIKRVVRSNRGLFNNWNPKLVQFVSPQVWASRPGRAYELAQDYDLLLSIFPFEKEWYAQRVPQLRLDFVGHPMLGRFQKPAPGNQRIVTGAASPKVVLLPGSRADEVRRHWGLVAGAFDLLRQKLPGIQGTMILPDEALLQSLKHLDVPQGLKLQAGGLAAALGEADLALTKSGTITMECALFGVPAVVFYKTSWPTYWIGRQIVNVKYLAMPNLMSGEEIFPEFIQHSATTENLSRAGLELLQDPPRREKIRRKLADIVDSLGGPGAIHRSGKAVLSLLH